MTTPHRLLVVVVAALINSIGGGDWLESVVCLLSIIHSFRVLQFANTHTLTDCESQSTAQHIILQHNATHIAVGHYTLVCSITESSSPISVCSIRFHRSSHYYYTQSACVHQIDGIDFSRWRSSLSISSLANTTNAHVHGALLFVNQEFHVAHHILLELLLPLLQYKVLAYSAVVSVAEKIECPSITGTLILTSRRTIV